MCRSKGVTRQKTRASGLFHRRRKTKRTHSQIAKKASQTIKANLKNTKTVSLFFSEKPIPNSFSPFASDALAHVFFFQSFIFVNRIETLTVRFFFFSFPFVFLFFIYEIAVAVGTMKRRRGKKGKERVVSEMSRGEESLLKEVGMVVLLLKPVEPSKTEKILM